MYREWLKHFKQVNNYLKNIDNADQLKWWSMHTVILVILTVFFRTILELL